MVRSRILMLEELRACQGPWSQNLRGDGAVSGSTADAYHITAPVPGGEGSLRAMKLAVAEAGLGAYDDIDYINAHGTSTPHQRSVTETARRLRGVFGDYAKNGLVVSSTKSMTGHLLGSGRRGGSYFHLALALYNSVVPPTINYDNSRSRM